MDWMIYLLSSYQTEETIQQCYTLFLRIYDECIKYLPDLRLSFITQMYSYSYLNY